MKDFHLVKVNKANIMAAFFSGWFMAANCVRMAMKTCRSKI